MAHDGEHSAGGPANSPGGDRAQPPRSGSESTLQMTVVEYAERSDRCTIYPPGLSAVARMSTWITADRSAFEPLAERR